MLAIFGSPYLQTANCLCETLEIALRLLFFSLFFFASTSLSHFITPFPGIKSRPDTDTDSVCHPSLSLSLSPSLLQGPECLQMHFSVAHYPSLASSLSPCLTLSIFLSLSSPPMLSRFSLSWTQSNINKAREQRGERDEQKVIETLSKCGPLLQFIHLPGESPAFTADTTIEKLTES